MLTQALKSSEKLKLSSICRKDAKQMNELMTTSIFYILNDEFIELSREKITKKEEQKWILHFNILLKQLKHPQHKCSLSKLTTVVLRLDEVYKVLNRRKKGGSKYSKQIPALTDIERFMVSST
jgi:hypothetical protein